MAVNLRAKVAREDTLHIHDVASEALDAFAKAHSNGVHIAQSAREVASKSVRIHFFCLNCTHNDELFVLSMI